MIPIQEEPVTLTELSKLAPKINGRRLAVSTLHRWSSKGVQGVRLETCRAGRHLLSSLPALRRFWNRLDEVNTRRSEAHQAPTPTAPTRAAWRSDKLRAAAVEAADREADARGL